MGLIDMLKEFLGTNKKNPRLITTDLVKTYGGTNPLEVALYDDKTPLIDKEILIKVNGVEYNRRTDTDGIAKLNINLPVGVYTALISYTGDDVYNQVSDYTTVTINPVVNSNDLTMTYKDGNSFKAVLKDINNKPVSNVAVFFKINNLNYSRRTDNDGVASLPINLNAGTYEIETKVAGVSKKNNVFVNKRVTRMEGTDINMRQGDSVSYQCAVYDGNNRVSDKVEININGKRYIRSADNEGLYKLAINLPVGTYGVLAKYNGNTNYDASSVENTIKVDEPPKPEPKPEPTPAPVECPKPYTSSPHPTASGCNAMGQNNSVYCAPSSIHKALYKFGIRDITQGQIASWAGTGSAGTSHSGIETAIAKINQVKGTNIKIKWYNFSDLGWEEIGKILCQSNKAVFCHILYKNGGTCNGSGNYGHYELLTKVNTSTGYVKVLNSLGGYCGSCYCGFYQDRSMSCQELFMRGISQKSVAVLTKN